MVWWCFALVVLLLLMVQQQGESHITMVQTLTRHGTRAPDKIVGKEICKPMFNPKQSLHEAYVQLFGVGPAELTAIGVRQMRDVGAFLRERYHGFLWSDYGSHSNEWEFISKEGDRQQRSMMGIVLGIFPNDVVPIAVTNKETDSILGGPAAQCAPYTHDYIINWHATKGRAMMQSSKHAELITTLERVCNVSLRMDPVNERANGANPHAYIGDISDFFDSLRESRFEDILPISSQMHTKLTKLAFKLEHGAHFDFPGGAAMHAGSFPNHLLEAFEDIAEHKGERPKRVPKIKMHTCSRELFYGLNQVFDWSQSLHIPGQPIGRIRPGTTYIWELHSDMKIRSYYYQHPDTELYPLMPPVTIEEFRKRYVKGVNKCGTWDEVCVEKRNQCEIPEWFKESAANRSSQQQQLRVSNKRMSNPPPDAVTARHRDYHNGWAAYFGWVMIGAFLVLVCISFNRSFYDGYSNL